MKLRKKGDSQPTEVLYRVKRGLAAYISYLSACEMNGAFSEYVLYEPLLRIMTARGYTVKCEVECPGIQHASKGDRRRLDFVADGHNLLLAIEVKWARSAHPRIEGDVEKLTAFAAANSASYPLLCIFGRQSFVSAFETPDGFRERGEAVYADLRKTKYGCRIFQLKPRSTMR